MTPEQIGEAHRQLLEAQHGDWLYEPEVAEELIRGAKRARKELAEGKASDWEDFQKE